MHWTALTFNRMLMFSMSSSSGRPQKDMSDQKNEIAQKYCELRSLEGLTRPMHTGHNLWWLLAN